MVFKEIFLRVSSYHLYFVNFPMNLATLRSTLGTVPMNLAMHVIKLYPRNLFLQKTLEEFTYLSLCAN